MPTILFVFGTRPEVIKLAPVMRALTNPAGAPPSGRSRARVVNVSSTQQSDLLPQFLEPLGVHVDHHLGVMSPRQSSSEVCARVLAGLEGILTSEAPDLVLVQGDTTTALAGALSGFYRGVPVGHVEAGLRSGDRMSPFPEEVNRQLITRLATYHFAATPDNVATLRAEGVRSEDIALVGNPVVDSLLRTLSTAEPSDDVRRCLEAADGRRLLVLTTHRRESFGDRLREHLKILRDFVDDQDGVLLAFPVHPNPNVAEPAREILGGRPRIVLLPPLDHASFLHLASRAWLLVSDSGGVQEEAPTLKKPLLILRENTERPEAVECGVARLVGSSPGRLRELLDEALRDDSWTTRVGDVENPFGCGDSGERIARAIENYLSTR